jgi:hypothetical protein
MSKKIDHKEEDYQLGNLFQGKSVSLGSQNKNLNAKKLDINFDADDFFNSFEPMNTAPKQTKIESKKDDPIKTENQFDAAAWSFEPKQEPIKMNNIEDVPPKPKVTTTS